MTAPPFAAMPSSKIIRSMVLLFWTLPLAADSALYTGVTGGFGIGLNRVHGAGYALGMSVDYLAYKTYGLHFAAETGEYAAKDGTLKTAGGATVLSPGSGTFGFLSFDLAAVYAFPRLFGVEPAISLGASLYQLRGGAYNFNQTIAPLAYASAHYNLFSHLQVGFLAQLTLPSAGNIESTGTSVSLDGSAALAVLTLKLSLRYAWF